MPSTSDVDLSRLRIDRGDEPSGAAPPVRGRNKRRRIRWVGPILTLLVVLAIAWFAWPIAAPYLERWRAPEVRVALVTRERPGAENESTSAAGYVVARTRASIAAEVAGRLVELKVDVGSRVEAGELLARIDAGTWVHGVEQMRAQIAQQEAEVKAAEIRVVIGEKAVTRIDRATEESKLAVREVEVELAEAERVLAVEEQLGSSRAGIPDTLKRARNDVERIRVSRDRRLAATATLAAERASAEAEVRGTAARIGVAEATVREMRAKLAAAEVTLRQTEIRAPFSGVILRKEAEIGEMVVPALAGGSTSRGAVVSMADFSSLEMEVDVFERDIANVQEGGPAEIEINAHSGTRFPATVRQIVPTAERSKGTILVKVAFDWRGAKPDPRILPEMGGKVIFLKGTPTGAKAPEVRVARGAVVTRGNAQGVFVIEGERARWHPVALGEPREGNVVVLSGIQGGDKVILDPSAAISDGMIVRPSG